MKKYIFLSLFLLLFLLAACGGGEETDVQPPDDGSAPAPAPSEAPPAASSAAPPPVSGSGPAVPFTALAFSWDDPGIIAGGGARSVDITSNSAAISLQTAAPAQMAVGLLAVNGLTRPALDGHLLLNAMPPESAITIRPDGAAVFAAWDLFDPQWRGRQPRWEQVEGDEGVLTIDYLANDAQPAKVARTTRPQAEGEMLFLQEEGTASFYWNGWLEYCFEFGRPVRSVSLSDPSGQRQTRLNTLPGLEIRLSDGGEWRTVWVAEVEEGNVQPEIALPADLEGAETLCLSLGSETGDYYTIEQLYLTVHLAADDLTDLTRFPAGERTLAYAGQGDGAILFWDDPAVVASQTLPDYPTGAPTVNQTGDALQIAFSSGVLLEFPLKNGAPGGLSRMVVGEQTVFQAPPGQGWTPPARITLLQGDPAPLPPGFDWDAYRDAAIAVGEWPPVWKPLWTRARQTISLADGRFQGAQVNGNEVTLAWSLNTPDGAGQLELIFAPAELEMAGTTLTGVAVQARLSGDGLAAAERVALEFPLLVSPGDWQIEQTFRQMAKDRLTLTGAPRYPQSIWFGHSQSFAFRTGPGRTVLGLFEKPTWATVNQKTESGRHLYIFDLPLSAGETRETTPLYWLTTPNGAADRFTAANIWGRFHEEIRAAYLAQSGIRYTPPRPTVTWNQPAEEQLLDALEYFVDTGEYPPEGESWFDWYAANQLPRAAAAGVQNVIIQAPWVSDAEDPALIASLHAPRDFIVSPLLGGRDGLKRLVEEAHGLGIQVTLWYPSSFSLYSPLISQSPERLTWKINGTPDDYGWGDVLSLNKYEPHRQYVIEKLTELHQEIPFDGLWLDSWVGLAVPTDYAQAQPVPQLEEAIAFQRAFSEMGLSQIVIEGLGPTARSDAYGDYESYAGGPQRTPEITADVERLRDHEYLLYAVGAGAYLADDTMPLYHRLLASGGLLNIANFDEIEALSKDGQAWLRQINRDYARVMAGMQYRQLLADGESWLGTAWTAEESADVIVFAFAPFALGVGDGVTVEDVTANEQFETDGPFQTAAWHTYVLRGVNGH